MRYILTIILIAVIAPIYGQVTYESSVTSYRTNYYLVFRDANVTFYGWELNLEKDTIYFKTSGPLIVHKNSVDGALRQDSTISFKKFEFSKVRIAENELNKFQADDKSNVETFLLHRLMIVQQSSEKRLKVVMVKDIYDGRSDEFEFIRRK